MNHFENGRMKAIKAIRNIDVSKIPQMSISKTGKSFVLFGTPDNNAAESWVEKRFPSLEAAIAYAQKRGWKMKDVPK